MCSVCEICNKCKETHEKEVRELREQAEYLIQNQIEMEASIIKMKLELYREYQDAWARDLDKLDSVELKKRVTLIHSWVKNYQRITEEKCKVIEDLREEIELLKKVIKK